MTAPKKNPAESNSAESNLAEFNWQDPFDLDSQLTAEERMVRDNIHEFCQQSLMPDIITACREENFDPAIMRRFGEMGMLGSTLPAEFGGAEFNHV